MATTQTLRPSVGKYQDSTQFLKDWFLYLKTMDRKFSLRALARKSGVSVSYLTMMTQKKRPLTSRLFNKIAPHLKLDALEMRILERLVDLALSATTEDKKAALRRLQNLRSYKEINPAEWEVHKYLSKWFNLAIREMVQLRDFRNDPSWIKDRLLERISQSEVVQALELLVQLGLVDNDDGKLSIQKRTLQCHDDIFRISLGSFHHEMLNLAAKSIAETPRDQRVILGSTIGMPKERIGELFEMVHEFQRKLEKWAEPFKEIDEIYHFEAAAFPLTKKNGSDQ